MKKSIATALLLALFGFSSQAQIQNYGSIEGNRIITKKSTDEITGSPYLEETFRASKVDGNTISMIRYNIKSGQIEYKNGTEIWALSPKKDAVIATTDGKYAYVYTDYVVDGQEDTGYLVLLTALPKIKLYAKHRVTIQEAVESNGYQNAKPAAYKRADVKYLASINGQPITNLSTKKKDLIKMFPGKDAEISDYFKKNKVSDNEADMVKLAEFLDTII